MDNTRQRCNNFMFIIFSNNLLFCNKGYLIGKLQILETIE